MANTRRYAASWCEVVQPPVGLKEMTRSSLRHALISTLDHFKRPANEGSVRLLYCHYVFDDQVEDFDLIIRSLKRLGTFVSTDVCIEMLSGIREVDGSYFHLSFDDGFRNVCVNAAPILQRHHVPAFFLCPLRSCLPISRGLKNSVCTQQTIRLLWKWPHGPILRSLLQPGVRSGHTHELMHVSRKFPGTALA